MKIGRKKLNLGIIGAGIVGLITSLWLIFGPGIEDIPVGKIEDKGIEKLKDSEIGETKIHPAEASQNWPTTDSTTGHQTDHLTNAVQRDDTLRSNWSGTTCPGSPVEGQHCYDTDDDLLYVYDGTAWVEIITTPTSSCSAGYDLINGWCVDSDGNLTQLFSDTSDSDTNDTTVNSTTLANAKIALVKFYCAMASGTTGTHITQGFVRPFTSGDQTTQFPETACIAITNQSSGAGFDRQISELYVRLDGNGDFEYELDISGGNPTSTFEGYLAAYME